MNSITLDMENGPMVTKYVERARSAKTGLYVKKSYAKAHPATTVVERDKVKPRPKKRP